MDSIGQRIKQARNKLGLSQTRLGALCHGLSRSAIAQWEANETTPTGPNLVEAAKILGVATEWLVEGGDLVRNSATNQLGENPLDAQIGELSALDEDLFKLAVAAALSFIEVNDLQVAPKRASELFLAIYQDAKENLSDGTHESPVIATTASAKAILRTLK